MKTMNTDIRPRKFQGLLEIMKALVIKVYYLSSTKNFGLLSEFYKKFWHLCESLINSFHAAFESEFCPSRRGRQSLH